jgi:hypothetical protein
MISFFSLRPIAAGSRGPPAGNKYEQFLAVLREYERYICSCVLPLTIDDEMQAS